MNKYKAPAEPYKAQAAQTWEAQAVTTLHAPYASDTPIHSNQQLHTLCAKVFSKHHIQRVWMLGRAAKPGKVVWFLVELPQGADIYLCSEVTCDLEDILAREVIISSVTKDPNSESEETWELVYDGR